MARWDLHELFLVGRVIFGGLKFRNALASLGQVIETSLAMLVKPWRVI
ncbi:MAG: hypothetical protein ACKO10_01515 [Betaproteobacteria bacterium]